ncbi:thiosulfate/3-mercaptopyruvate sulfurtransferase [Actinokineospora alba]|uniref:Thiosulfate/3-mercaptopyruvate sulfurtransferase n=1 Tax=Actinokineospora alba TaxID=504798 RepID=A0A1H0JEI3_9PSEU|nr:sulfurtransferase [Actinokineospora alba]TDP68320.1 thiosulfate/3-mercaptopyruvate sulfurtransferase [Actinokineospora alba]SDH96798.1 thiosulfate/3-mercaptopyruvate sulfurtransferase [Actinokineospora alba]SDO42106.1 thiosulfate/3-mercaptopyruvate sulfurtransferase [Actinokineospora alba]
MTALTGPLISAADLLSWLDSPNSPVLLDVRWRLGGPPGREDYAEGHLPGAVYLDLDADLAAAPGAGGRHPLPAEEDLQRVLREAGVRADRPVVAYDSDNGSIAARVWWLLRWAGHEDVVVLDGGYAAWVAAGNPVTTDEVTPEEGDIEVRPGGMPVVDADGAADLAREGVLLDARAPERYRGDIEPIDPRAGHVPGARNAPFTEHLRDGRWKPATELAERFEALGVRPGEPVGAYCGSGVTASSVVLALEVAGVTTRERPAALYAGSWSHWCVDPTRPVATGDQPGE